MWQALPAAEHYGDSATPRCHRSAADLPAAVLAARREGRHPGASHVRWVPVSRGGAQLSPGSLATSTPQAFPLACLAAKVVTFGVATHQDPHRGSRALLTGPHPPGSSRLCRLRGQAITIWRSRQDGHAVAANAASSTMSKPTHGIRQWVTV
jgi:hypothetical protein